MIELVGRNRDRPKVAGGRPMSILVFRIGQLGDMIVSLPSMWAVRRRWPEAKLTLLCDVHSSCKYVMASDIFRGTGLYDAIEEYDVPAGGHFSWQALRRQFLLLRKIRSRRYDAVIYLAPSVRKREQVRRDVAFFKAAGVRRIYGARHFPPVPIKRPGEPFAFGEAEADLLLARLGADGIPVPERGRGSLDLRLGNVEAAEVAGWVSALSFDGGRRWLGVGPGSKMQSNRWPLERYAAAVEALIARYDVWPVVFGGPEDRPGGDRLLTGWGRGYNAAGALSVRGSAKAIKNCILYLGNDTGTMHLAASVGTPCAALFSARDWPGAWYPYGVPRKIFRSEIECEGCYLVECLDRRNACLTRISVAQVVAGCEDLMRDRSARSYADTSE
jgi:heptosyltransferase-3